MNQGHVLKILLECEKALGEVNAELLLWAEENDLSYLNMPSGEVPIVLYKDGERIEVGMARIRHDDGALTMTGVITKELEIFENQKDSYSISLGVIPDRTPGVTHGTMIHMPTDEFLSQHSKARLRERIRENAVKVHVRHNGNWKKIGTIVPDEATTQCGVENKFQEEHRSAAQ